MKKLMSLSWMIALLAIFLSSSLDASEISIRTAEETDIDALYELICELAAYERKDVSKLPLTRENLARFGFGENPYFYSEIAEVEGEVAGFVLYFYTFSAHQGFPVLYIEDLYVKPKYQKQGLGTLFFKRLASLAKERDCCRLEGHVFDWNEKAIAFYEGLGAELRRDLIMLRAHKKAMDDLTR